MEKRIKRPDSEAVLTDTVRAAMAAAKKIAGDLPLFAGGKSMGGRMTSLDRRAPTPRWRARSYFFRLSTPRRRQARRRARRASSRRRRADAFSPRLARCSRGSQTVKTALSQACRSRRIVRRERRRSLVSCFKELGQIRRGSVGRCRQKNRGVDGEEYVNRSRFKQVWFVHDSDAM